MLLFFGTFFLPFSGPRGLDHGFKARDKSDTNL